MIHPRPHTLLSGLHYRDVIKDVLSCAFTTTALSCRAAVLRRDDHTQWKLLLHWRRRGVSIRSQRACNTQQTMFSIALPHCCTSAELQTENEPIVKLKVGANTQL